MICVYCLISYFPKLWFRNFDGFGLFFGYQSVHIGMGFVDLVWILVFLVFAWVLIGLGSNLKKI